ncbi:Rhodanese-like protein [Eremomyces bilateralis CBS 781.70]|uniref:M-phase inducer phosphatase n=1 Tax=Eremomyces bilateralis CBS 781.70 TaxID=1392243 RepID=A0A6G1FYK7_9PEZI|nr:Rhodanese-like protein [Eremomyces bilateralis CBS 781.70]KAF1810781.1 Rhodanese-like protein [Eremomyces bilateralis CBS 781.70]
MELSSPLAAIQPNVWKLGGRFESSSQLGPNSFNFRDMSMKRHTSNENKDYFATSKPLRGSSPSASLAADLSSNFHIDQSPQLPPTPRRSLFTSNIFKDFASRDGATTPPIRFKGSTTPPIPSSPGFGYDIMVSSPLPHKPAARVSEIKFQISSPDSREDMIFPTDTQDCFTSMPRNESFRFENRRPFPRPSLNRTKCLSAYNVPRSRPENQLPPFKFGGGVTNISVSPNTLSLDDAFMASPPAKMPASPQLMGPPRSRPSFLNTNNTRGNGSPLSGQVKRSQCPFPRPRKQFRRSNSMFEHPGDVMKQDSSPFQGNALPTVMDVDDAYQLKLPHSLQPHEPDSLPRLDADTMIRVLDGEFAHLFDNTVVVDCRFEYEFDGGHIDGADNYNDKDKLARELFDCPSPSQRTLLILHCEYSVHRAPLMAKYIRAQDRAVNANHYPRLTYPEVYILDGGYSAFFNAHRTRCVPQSYVEMGSKEHERACERGMDRLRQRKKLSRAQTYAFGQRNITGMTLGGIQESPTAPQGRSQSHRMVLGRQDDWAEANNVFDTRRSLTKRMASY